MRTQCPRACSAGRPHHRSMRRTPLRHNSARHMSTQCHCRARLSLPACLHSVRSAGEQNHVTVTGCPHCSSADFKIALDARGGPRGGAQHLQTTLCVPSTPRAPAWRARRWSARRQRARAAAPLHARVAAVLCLRGLCMQLCTTAAEGVASRGCRPCRAAAAGRSDCMALRRALLRRSGAASG